MCGLQGIYVTRITPGGPAEVAGLKMGDKIMQVGSNNSPHWMRKPQDGAVGSSKKKRKAARLSSFLPGERLGYDHGDSRPGS